MATKKYVIDTLVDTVAKFTFYDRKEDDELPRGELERMVKDGELTVDELVEVFRKEMSFLENQD